MNQKLDLPSTENETSKLTDITPSLQVYKFTLMTKNNEQKPNFWDYLFHGLCPLPLLKK